MVAQLNDIAQVWWQWMGSMFWQVALLIAIITVLDMFLRKWAWPQVRYALWALVFIKLIISPAWQMPTSIVSWIQPQVEDKITFKVDVSENIEKGSVNFVPTDEDIMPVITEQMSWKSFALLAWFSGMVVFAFMLLRKMYKLRKMNRVENKTIIPEWFNELILKTAARLKLSKYPSVVFSKDAKSPAVYGVFRPVLLLPDGYLDKLSNEQAEHVLMHELCHLKRGDLLVHWFCIVVQIVYWFNPLLIWTRRQMRHICEICCDLSVANILREKTALYRETLLHSARELFAENIQPSLGFFGIFEEPFRLVPRLKWLEKKSWENRKKRVVVTIITSVFMVFCVMPMACIKQATASLNTEVTKQQEDENSASKKMVSLEALVIEVDFDKEFEVGVNWETWIGPKGEEPKYPGEQSESKINQGDSPPDPFIAAVLEDDITINGESYSDLGQVFRGMQNEPGVKIISNPKVMALNGEQADLSVSDKINSKLITSFSMKVTPTTSLDKFVQLQLEQVYSKQLDDSPAPTTFNRNLKTTVRIKDGQTVIIGGLVQTNNDKDETSENKKNLYVFLTPRIIKQGQSPVSSLLNSVAKKEINSGNHAGDAEAAKLEQKKLKEGSDNVIQEESGKLNTIVLSQLNISTIIIGEKGSWAMVNDNKGNGYVVKEGTPIGINRGVVYKIQPGEVIIREEYTDSKGNTRFRDISKKVQPPDARVSKTADKKLMNLDFHDTDIITVLKTLNEATKENIIWDPAIKDRKVSMVLKEIPAEEALDLVLKNNELEKRIVGPNIIWIATKEKMVRILAAEEAEASKFEQKKIKEGSDSKAPNKADKKLMNLDFHDTDIVTALKTLNEATKENIIWDPAIKGRKVSMVLKEIPAEEALDLVLKNNELEKRIVGPNIIWITTKEKMNQVIDEEKKALLKEKSKIKGSADTSDTGLEIKYENAKKIQGVFNIASKEYEYNLLNAFVEFKGNVIITHDSMVLTADNAKIFFKDKVDVAHEINTENIKTLVANGNVRMEFEKGVMNCDNVIFDIETNKLFVTGAKANLSVGWVHNPTYSPK